MIVASGLEEEVSVIQPLYDAVAAAAPEYDMEKIRQTLYGTFWIANEITNEISCNSINSME